MMVYYYYYLACTSANMPTGTSKPRSELSFPTAPKSQFGKWREYCLYVEVVKPVWAVVVYLMYFGQTGTSYVDDIKLEFQEVLMKLDNENDLPEKSFDGKCMVVTERSSPSIIPGHKLLEERTYVYAKETLGYLSSVGGRSRSVELREFLRGVKEREVDGGLSSGSGTSGELFEIDTDYHGPSIFSPTNHVPRDSSCTSLTTQFTMDHLDEFKELVELWHGKHLILE